MEICIIIYQEILPHKVTILKINDKYIKVDVSRKDYYKYTIYYATWLDIIDFTNQSQLDIAVFIIYLLFQYIETVSVLND